MGENILETFGLQMKEITEDKEIGVGEKLNISECINLLEEIDDVKDIL